MRFTRPLLYILTLLVLAAPALGDELSENKTTFRLILKVVSNEIEKNYYDPKLRGLDWKIATDEARDRIDKAQNVTQMAQAIWLLTSKLKDSHTGFVPPGRSVKCEFGFDAKPIGNEIRVFELRRGGAAEKAGIKLGDRIVKVNSFSASRSSFDDMMYLFRVIANSSMMEIVYQRDDDAPQTVRLQAVVKVQPKVLEDEQQIDSLWEQIRESQRDEYKWHYANYDGIGYAQLRSFGTSEEFIMKLVRNSDYSKGLLIDLRTNGGGYADTLKEFTGHFEQQPVTMFKSEKRKETKDFVVKPKGPYIGVPVVILVDSESGSAAEIFARHMQLQHHSVIVGDTTSGRVTEARGSYEKVGAGSIIPFTLSINTGRVVFPDGNELEKVGVKPDVRCLPTGKDLREERDVCLARAIDIAKNGGRIPEPSKQGVPQIEANKAN